MVRRRHEFLLVPHLAGGLREGGIHHHGGWRLYATRRQNTREKFGVFHVNVLVPELPLEEIGPSRIVFVRGHFRPGVSRMDGQRTRSGTRFEDVIVRVQVRQPVRRERIVWRSAELLVALFVPRTVRLGRQGVEFRLQLAGLLLRISQICCGVCVVPQVLVKPRLK